MPKDLYVPITATPGDEAAISAALALARRFGARLTVLEIVNLPVPASNPWGLMPDVAIGDVHDRLRAQGQANVERRRAALADSGVPFSVHLVEALFAEPPRLSVDMAHHADLSVVTGPVNDGVEGSVAHDFVASLLLGSGRPVLVIPPGATAPEEGGAILVAWRPGAEAARALHDALPLLRGASRVDVLAIDPSPGAEGGLALDDVGAHLARHGVQANVVVQSARGRAVSAILLEHAREMPAQLIVAGGYGHSRLREWVMGGVTRELLLGSPVPLLLSH
ncbi:MULTISPECIES: universal stress protein [unclassified Luteimonas]|uniref:universal stress protein n=1 Tax=unclassified Luteimonas TaxID=2629088 RepID=UPI0018F0B86B|nr:MULTISPECIES: universal stress protein [unclassified Luteimonas]MBJ6980643.1 universal stress protein [Luteimonas sp. MC1572]MBJ7574093.1 universal stress protein [Luteimonas sp. MC1828]QQO02021.1 universal stress protein [Luteimonas sp. MC1572]